MRRLPTYPAARIADVFASQKAHNPGAHIELLADLCAEVLTSGQGDDLARNDAAKQVIDWRARQAVEVAKP